MRINIYKFLSIIALLIVMTSSLAGRQVFAQNAQNFSFESFNADYYLDRTSEGASVMEVKETLVADFPDYDQNHGILRAVPERYGDHSLNLDNISVTDENGAPYQFTSSSQNNNKVLKIGDPNTYVHGKVVYKINYQLHDVINFQEGGDHDELFWDINGDQWQQPFGTVTAAFHISDQLAGSLQDRRLCYTGAFGSTAQNCSIKQVASGGETQVKASASNLQPGQTLSAVLAFNPGTFHLSSNAKKEQRNQKIANTAALAIVVVVPLLISVFMFRRWRAFGDDPKGRGIIVPEYEPPAGFDVMSSDSLLNQKLSNKAVSAALIDLAIKGYITIYEIPKSGLFGSKDYQLKITKASDENVPSHVREILEAIFGAKQEPGESVSLSEYKNNYSKSRAFYSSIQRVDKSLADNLTSNGYFIKNPQKVKNGYRGWAAGLFFLSIALFFIGGMLSDSFSVGTLPIIALGVAAIISALIIFLFSFIMPARTEKGVAAHDALLGLKDYIKLAEADRLKFLQSPQGAEKIPVTDQFDPKTPEAKVKLFEKLLPYAMLFGLEKDWAKQFNDIYTTPPSWYQGGDWTAFNAGYLAGSLGDFNSAASTSFASPSSSSGSGFGGGFAGGGGGGGGGGGW